MPRPPRHVFVAGLHRSGTSLVASALARHPQIASIRDSRVPEDEGVYLQGAIPHTARSGVPGAFAFDAEQHLIEGGRYDTAQVADRLRSDWDPWFDANLPWRVEKSPVNLLRMRLYQQIFPMAHFVIVLRHPAMVSQATRKWSDATPARLMQHWQAAHALVLDDLPFLHCVLILRYEEVVARPDAVRQALAAFLDIRMDGLGLTDGLHDGNAVYDALPDLALPKAARSFGYTEDPDRLDALADELRIRHALRDVRSGVLSQLGQSTMPPRS